MAKKLVKSTKRRLISLLIKVLLFFRQFKLSIFLTTVLFMLIKHSIIFSCDFSKVSVLEYVLCTQLQIISTILRNG